MRTNEQSIKALQWQIESGKMKSDMARILAVAMEGGGFNSEQMRVKLQFDKKSTCNARISGLLDLGLIRAVGDLKVQKFSHTIFLYEPDPEEQKSLAKQRRIDKFWKVLNRLHNEFPDLLDEYGYSFSI